MTDQGQLDALAAAATPCRRCGRPHVQRDVADGFSSWADPDDGHVYVQMSGEEVSALLVATVRERDELRAAVADLLALSVTYRMSIPLDGVEYDPKSGEGVIRRLRAALHSETTETGS